MLSGLLPARRGFPRRLINLASPVLPKRGATELPHVLKLLSTPGGSQSLLIGFSQSPRLFAGVEDDLFAIVIQSAFQIYWLEIGRILDRTKGEDPSRSQDGQSYE
jgi:hypothetical protein